MSKYVSRRKYNKLLDKSEKWVQKCDELSTRLDEVLDENNNLKRQIKQLKSVEIPDTDLMDELESENKNFRKELRNLRRQMKVNEEKYKNRIAQLDRDILLKDGKIQRLEEARKDLKERYTELKEDYREQQRWNRNKSGRD